jgi:hypothetical protein
MSKENQLLKWLKDEKFLSESKQMSEPSHLIMNGGKVFIPRKKEYEFYKKYAEELKNNSKLYFVEVRSEVFKFMIDIDISDDHYWSLNEIKELTKFINEVVYDYFKSNNNVICAVSEEKIKGDDIHTGIHLIFPKIFVNSESAILIRKGVVQKLKEGYKPLKKSWEDIIDEVIYTRNGYRMVGSDKYTKGKCENRELVVKFIMDSKGNLKEDYLNRLNNNKLDLVSETAIRNVLPIYNKKNATGMEVKLPEWLNLEKIVMDTKIKSKTHKSSLANSKEHLIIEHFIRTHLPKVYSSNVVVSVERYPDNNLLIKTNSRYCLNMEREHKSCGIYFLGTPEGVYQKCLCPCENLTGRKYGYCRDFTSECFIFDEETVKMLFEDSKKKDKKEKNVFIPGSTSKKAFVKDKSSECNKLLNQILEG